MKSHVVLFAISGALLVVSLTIFVMIPEPIHDSQRAGPGAPCGAEADCQLALSCEGGTCVTAEERRVLREAQASKDAAASALPAVATSGRAPFSVKVRRASNKSQVYVSCAVDERLIGGGCEFPQTRVSQDTTRPDGYAADDTMGARWYCSAAFSDTPITAYALCMWIPAQP